MPLPWDTALVTGASSGIGAAIAHRLASGGVGQLVLVARRSDRLEASAEALRTAHGTDVEVLAADLASDADRARVDARLRSAELPPVDLAVNCAGVGTSGPFVELPVIGELHEVAVNVAALVQLTHAAVAGMVTRGHGAILNVSSMASYQPSPGNATYGATKAFVTSFSESLFEELRGTGVTVTALCPGYTRTEFQDTAGADQSGVPGFAWTSVDLVAETGVAAAAAGRALAIPGLGYRFVAGLTTPLPRSAKRWIMGRAAGSTAGRRRR